MSADLILRNVDIENDSIETGDVYGPNLTAGEEIAIEWEVKNVGDDDARSSEVQIWLTTTSGTLIERLATTS